jgi:hypothetical protein
MAAGIGKKASLSPVEAARDAVTMAKAKLKGPPSLCLAFPDALTASASEIVAALGAELENHCAVFGGFAGGEELPGNKVFQFYGEEVLTDSVPIILFSGPLRFAYHVSNSWQPVGMRTTIDACKVSVSPVSAAVAPCSFTRTSLGLSTPQCVPWPCLRGSSFISNSTDYDNRMRVGFPFMSKNLPGSLTTTPEGIISDVDASRENSWTVLIGIGPPGCNIVSCASRKWILHPGGRGITL